MSVSCIGVELTDRCDLACSHCLRHVVPPNSPRARDIDVDLVRRIVAQSVEQGIGHIGFTGGEPMLHPRFLDIIDIVIDAGLTYHFLSNALGLPQMLPRLLSRPERRSSLRDICISLDGATEQSHDRVRGRGMFRRTLAGIAVLRAMKIPFVLLNCVSRVNRHEIEQMGLLAHHLGAKKLYYTHFLPNGRRHATEDLDLTSDERHDVEAVIYRLADALRFPIGMGEGYYVPEADHRCGTVQLLTLNVDASGYVTFCCELSSFNGDNRPAQTRPDFVADLSKVSLGHAIRLQAEAVDRFRAHRLAEAAAGTHTEEDRFACRYCIRHFGKPDGGTVVPLRRRVPGLSS